MLRMVEQHPDPGNLHAVTLASSPLSLTLNRQVAPWSNGSRSRIHGADRRAVNGRQYPGGPKLCREDSGHQQVPDARLTGRLNFCAHSGTVPDKTTRAGSTASSESTGTTGRRSANPLSGYLPSLGRCWCSSRRSMRPNGTAASPGLCCLPWWLAGRLVSGTVCLAAIRGRDLVQQQGPGSACWSLKDQVIRRRTTLSHGQVYPDPKVTEVLPLVYLHEAGST